VYFPIYTPLTTIELTTNKNVCYPLTTFTLYIYI
jgi:hypothetical protein